MNNVCNNTYDYGSKYPYQNVVAQISDVLAFFYLFTNLEHCRRKQKIHHWARKKKQNKSDHE